MAATSIVKLKVESSEYDAKIKRAAQGLQHFEDECRKTGKSLNTLDKDQLAYVRSISKMETVSRGACGRVNELSKAYTDFAALFNRLSNEEKKGQFGREMSKQLEILKTRVVDAKSELNGIQSEIGGKGGFASLAGSAVKMAGALGLATGGFQVLRSVVGGNISLARDFEQAQANVASVLGTTRANTKLLTDDALRLGAATQYTASEVSGLQENLARLGFTQTEIKNSTASILDFAAATGADLASSANLAGAALRSFGLDSTEMERVVSSMAVGTTKSALNFEYLNTAMSTIAPVAKAAGYEIEDVVTLLGMLANSGFDASSAATATRNILLMLADSNSKLSKEFGKPVKSLEDLADALQELNKRGVDLGEMFQLTDKRSVAAFATFVAGSDKLKNLKESVSDCGQELKKMVEERTNTLEGSMKKLSSAWEGFNLALNSSNGALKDCVDWLTDVVSWMADVATKTDAATEALKRFNKENNSDENSYKGGKTRGQQIGEYNKRKHGLDTEINRLGDNLDWYDRQLADKGLSDYRRQQLEKNRQLDVERRNALIAERRKLIDSGKAYFYGSGTTTTPTGGGGGGGAGSTGTGKKNEYVPLEGSIDYLQKLASEAKKMITSATTDLARDEAQKLYNEYMSKIKALQQDMETRANVKGVSLADKATDNPLLSGKIEVPKIELPKSELQELTESLKALETLRDMDLITEEQLGQIDALREKLKQVKDAIPLTPAEKAQKLADENAKNWSNAASAIGSVGQALSNIEDPAAKVAGIVAQAIATVAGTFAKSLSGVKMGPWEWIAAAAAGTATMISTIASIKSATEYHAEGGIVGMKGLAKGTDIVPAMLTPGEVVLSNSQTSNLASKLQSNNSQDFTAQPYLQGEMIFVGINNALGRMGRGEIVTTSMLKKMR